MINIEFKSKNNLTYSLNVAGHAFFDNYGKDIVCASVSGIIFGALNGFDKLIDDIDTDINKKDAIINLSVNNPNEKTQLLFEFIKIQLQTINESYKNYLIIKEV